MTLRKGYIIHVLVAAIIVAGLVNVLLYAGAPYPVDAYSQGGYYSEGAYYSQGGYAPQAFYGVGSTFTFEYEPNGYCAKVQVAKNDTHPRTVIQARGYNVTCAQIATNPRVLERAIEISY